MNVRSFLAEVAQRLRHLSHTQAFEGSSPSLGTEVTMETVIIEIRAAEGGADAKLLVTDQLRVYATVGALRGL